MKHGLKIKPVTIEYLDQYNELMRYVFQVTERQLLESGYEDGELIRSKRPVLQEAEILGWFTEDDELVSQICIYPCEINVHGQIFEMGGVTGVGTYPEYANLGLMSELIKLSLHKMRESGQYISYLYPYSIPYYRRKGWEIISDHMTFAFKDNQLPKQVEVPGFVERLDVKDADVMKVYDNFARSIHGSLIRNKFEWDEYWRWENEEERTAAVYYDVNEKPQGCMFYWIEGDVFHIKDIFYLNQEARHGLWNFVRAHYSMIDEVKGDSYLNEPIAFELEDSHIVETIEPYYMARIVDVANFLKSYPWDDDIKPFHFIVTDPIAEWNNGIFGIRQNSEGHTEIVNETIGKAVELDIRTLSTMMMSYKSPAYLHKTERLKCDTKTLRLLEKLIPTETPYFSDYF